MAAISSNATPLRNGWDSRLEILGEPATEEQLASINLVSPGYFAELRIALLEGRIWTETENHDGAHVAVINRTLAERYFPNGDAIGHSLKLPGMQDSPSGGPLGARDRRRMPADCRRCGRCAERRA